MNHSTSGAAVAKYLPPPKPDQPLTGLSVAQGSSIIGPAPTVDAGQLTLPHLPAQPTTLLKGQDGEWSAARGGSGPHL